MNSTSGPGVLYVKFEHNQKPNLKIYDYELSRYN